MSDVTMELDKAQFNGPVRFKALERAIIATGKRKADMETLKGIEAAMTGTRKVEATSITSLVMGEAIDYLNGWFNLLLETPISSANIGLWLAARGVIPSVRRLMLVPDIYCGEQGLKKVLLTACWAVAILGRLADEDRVHEVEKEFQSDIEFDDMVKEALPIYLDIAVGRAGAWLSYIDFMGDQVAHAYADGTSWDALVAVAADTRTVELRDNLKRILGVNDAQAMGAMGGVMLTVAEFSEAQAAKARKDAGIEGVRADVLDKLRSMSSVPEALYGGEGADDLNGYAAEFKVSEFATTFQVPTQLEVELRMQRWKTIQGA